MATQTLQWFKDRIGKGIYCKTPNGKDGYSGEIAVTDEAIAGYLYCVAQNTMGCEFWDTIDNLILTREILVELKTKYNKCVTDRMEQFEFQGHQILTSYAKYLIQYAEMQFKD